MTKLAIDIWSDVMCPWCVIGWGNLQKGLKLVEGEIGQLAPSGQGQGLGAGKVNLEGQRLLIEPSPSTQHELGDIREALADAIQLRPRVLQPQLQPGMNILVEMLQQSLPGLVHA